MLFKIGVLIFLLIILYSLGSGLFYLTRRKHSDRVVKALTWRISLSLVLFVLLFLAYALGWIRPHGIS